MLDRPGTTRPARLPEFVGSWSAHVDSWTVDPPLPTTIVRYEDVLTDPVGQLRLVVDAVGLDCGDEVVREAVGLCSFTVLRRREDGMASS